MFIIDQNNEKVREQNLKNQAKNDHNELTAYNGRGPDFIVSYSKTKSIIHTV